MRAVRTVAAGFRKTAACSGSSIFSAWKQVAVTDSRDGVTHADPVAEGALMSIATFNKIFPGRGRGARIGYAVAFVAVCAVIAFALNAVYGFFGSSAASTGAQRTAT